MRDKKAVYQRIGVEEYILFDPYDEYLKPRLQGFRLQKGTYQQIPPWVDGTLQSRTTGVTFQPEGESLRLRDTETGELTLWPDEDAKGRVVAEQRAAAAEELVRQLAEELARLRRTSKPKRRS